MKTRCNTIGCILILVGIILSYVGNQLDIHNGKLLDDIRVTQRRIDDVDRRAHRAGSPEQGLKIYAEENHNDHVIQNARARLRMGTDAVPDSLALGFYLTGGTSLFLGVVLIIVGFVQPKTTTISTENLEQAIERRVIELEAKKRFEERERRRFEEERRKAEDADRFRREQQRLEEEKRKAEENEKRRQQREEKRRQQAIPLFQEALSLYTACRFEEAWKRCDKSIKLFPHANSYLLRAWILESGEEYRHMFDDCMEALRMNPNLPEGRYTRGKALLGMLNDSSISPDDRWLSMLIDDFESNRIQIRIIRKPVRC